MKLGKVVVVGGSGMVGGVLLEVMKKHRLQPRELVLVGSRSAGKIKQTPYGGLQIQRMAPEIFTDARFVFFAAGAKVSKDWIPQLRGNGFRIIDLSSAFRYDPAVPLVIPSINGDAIGDSDLIACPNCTTSIALMVLEPIHFYFGISRVSLVSYQAASGAGWQALEDLERQTRQWTRQGKAPKKGKTASAPLPLAGNLIPRIDVLDPAWNGFTKEEMKTHWEALKILFGENGGKTVYVNSTCVRVPVRRCHSEALTVQTEKQVDMAALRTYLGSAFGVKVYDDPGNWVFPMPINMEGKEEVGVGRIRLTPDGQGREVLLWVCGDQLLRGAALTAVEIVEDLAR
jgi:aspartate-semialdehyde dehydrogenase